MQPPVHLAVGYCCYAIDTRWDRGAAPDDRTTAAVLVGAALPDLIDKPLWLLGVAGVGRTAGHSLLVAVPLLVGVRLYANRSDRRALGTAFSIGLCSHLAADVPWHLLAGDYRELGFLLWPVTPMPAYTGTKPLGSLGGVEVTTLWLEVVIFAVGLAMWWADGRPGLERG